MAGKFAKKDYKKTMTSKKMNITKYDRTARGIHAPMYDYYAEKIKEKTGITKGVCLDLGSSGGYLGLALARITELSFLFVDISAEALERAKLHIIEEGLLQRAGTLVSDVHSIPLAGESADLVISRGSIPFWKEPGTALKEIFRLLSPGGKAYVGGGKGSPEIRDLIAARRKEMGLPLPPEDGERRKGPPRRMMKRNYDEIMEQTGIPHFLIDKGDDGVWIQMWK